MNGADCSVTCSKPMQRHCYPMCPYPRDVARPTCYRCCRPVSYCVCGFIVPFEAHTNLLILQHPHERRKYHSSSKLLRPAIKNSKIVRGINFEKEDIVSLCSGQKLFLLYPGIESLDVSATPLDRSCTVIAIDGTWVEARKIIHRNRFLRELPRLSFKKPLFSRYRIRKQPRAECLSTLESIAHLLLLNAAASLIDAPCEHYRSLIDGFEKMNEMLQREWPRMRGSSSNPSALLQDKHSASLESLQRKPALTDPGVAIKEQANN